MPDSRTSLRSARRALEARPELHQVKVQGLPGGVRIDHRSEKARWSQ